MSSREAFFSKEHLLDKTTISSKGNYEFADGKIESDYEDTTKFDNLTEWVNGINFDMTVVDKYTRYVIGKDGKRILHPARNRANANRGLPLRDRRA